jgi:hypothetical protein
MASSAVSGVSQSLPPFSITTRVMGRERRTTLDRTVGTRLEMPRGRLAVHVANGDIGRDDEAARRARLWRSCCAPH